LKFWGFIIGEEEEEEEEEEEAFILTNNYLSNPTSHRSVRV
jgi:hypothetical protein